MVDCVTTGKTLDLNDENTLPLSVLDLLQELLDDGAGGYCFARDDFTVDLRDIIMPSFCNFEQEFFVTGQSFTLAVSLRLDVGIYASKGSKPK